MKYRLAPFCRWHRHEDIIVLVTPDYTLTLPPAAEGILAQLMTGRVEGSSDIQALAEYQAVVGSESTTLRLLRRLETYFTSQNLPVEAVRKGATRPDAALPRKCYMVKTPAGRRGHGQARGRHLALLKATVELYERLSCDAIYNVDLLVTDTEVIPALSPEEFVSYKDWQFNTPGFPYGRLPSEHWAKVQRVKSDMCYKVPLELLCYPDRVEGRRVTAASSNGVASHTSYETALMSSAEELIERDALMRQWFWRSPREQITTPPMLIKRVNRLRALGFETTFINLTQELSPVVAVILHRKAKKYPRLLLGMSCNASPAVAMDKALQEVELNVTFYDSEVNAVMGARDIRGVMDHQFWYDRTENHADVFSLVGEKQITIADIGHGPDDSEQMHELLTNHGFIWYSAELNKGGRASTGIYVIRSLIKGLIPISFGYIMEPLGLACIQPPIRTLAS